MSFNVKVGGTWQTLGKGFVKIAGTWQEVQSAWVKVAGVWQQVFTGFRLTASETIVTGSDSGFTPCGNPGNTNSVTVSTVGGTAPFTTAWARVGAAADSGPYQANSPTSLTTSFSDADSSVCEADVTTDETWRCTVTDDRGYEATVDVTVRLLWSDLS